MDQPSNKTIMCSVFFLDIVGYSKRSVAGQISLKERFNQYLSAAIRDVPLADRIILDTGDGAAINFMGDIEDALKAALSLRSSMLHEDPNIDTPLLVRMGINLGPVRLVRDINGQPNIVGDGINVAQRIMGFADPSQILVSRSYFDAVSRLSPQYAGMFHYQGSRTDKHVREHDVYAIGYPGEKTARHVAQGGSLAKKRKFSSKAMGYLQFLPKKLDAILENLLGRFSKIDPKVRPVWVAAIGIPVVVLTVFAIKMTLRVEEPPVVQKVVVLPRPAPKPIEPASSVYASAVLAASSVSSVPVVTAEETEKVKKPAKSTLPSATAIRPSPISSVSKTTQLSKPQVEKNKTEQGASGVASKLFGLAKGSDDGGNARISLSCIPGTLFFVDGAKKGQVNSGDLVVDVLPGKHVVIAVLPNKKLFNESVDVAAGKMVKIKPFFCNK
jgi:hypothetical protein